MPTPPATRNAPDVVLVAAVVAVTFANVVTDSVAIEPVPAVVILPPVTLPVTDNAVSVPTDVTLGCAAVVSVPVKLVALTSVAPVKLPAVTLPVTANAVRVPTDVMLGCAAVVTVPAVVAAPVSAPTNVVDVTRLSSYHDDPLIKDKFAALTTITLLFLSSLTCHRCFSSI